MGCFNFGLRSKIQDNLSPESSSVIKIKSKSSSPSSSQSSSIHSTKSKKDQSSSNSNLIKTPFGGRPMPLPIPFSSKSLPNSKQTSPKTNPSNHTSNSSSFKDKSLKNKNIPPLKHSKKSQVSPKSSSTSPNSSSKSSSPRNELLSFSLAQLETMTDGFAIDGFLGEGGFGAVYRGQMMNETTRSEVTVAVKVLNTDGNQGVKEWLAEVIFLGKLSHPNLVKLIGYCAEGQQKLLVYELLPRGSLEHALFRPSPDSPLSWNLRMKIAIGAARGLAYLHEGAEEQVIFRDFKTSNVLLDQDWEARVSDFGLARHGPRGDQTHVTTKVVGTMGYAAPEYVMTGHLTSKSDVWGFGVVLLELLTGRLSLDKRRPFDEQNLVDWSMPYLKNPAKLYRIMDPDLNGLYSVRGAQIAASVTLGCLNHKPKLRPRMSQVVKSLLPVLDMDDMAGFTMQDLQEPSFLRKKNKNKEGAVPKNESK